MHRLVLLLCAAAFGFVAPVRAQRTIIGALEDSLCSPQPRRAVRPLFARTESGWVALDSRLRETTIGLPTRWTIAFDGRARGTVTVAEVGPPPTEDWIYQRDRRFALHDESSALVVRGRVADFESWCGLPGSRPLVVVAHGSAADPDRWRPSHPTASESLALFQAFRDRVPTVLHCPRDPERADTLRVDSMHLEIARTYRNRRGHLIAAVRLREALNGCDGPRGGAWSSQWFAVADRTHWIGEAWTLVDAGDYDIDGRSELVFWVSEYNSDGYVLVGSDLVVLASRRWSYH